MTKEITIIRTVTVQCGTHARTLPGDQRFILWYGLVGKWLTIRGNGPYVSSVFTSDGREWFLKTVVPRSEVEKVMDDASVTYEAGEDWYRRVPNPWCPKGLEAAWIKCAIRRANEHSARKGGVK